MKKIWLLLLLMTGMAQAQVRYDSNLFTAGTNVPIGAQAPMFTVPYAKVYICTSSTCPANLAAIYTDQGLSQPITQPIVADAQGRYGFWTASGTYFYQACPPSGTLPCSTGYLTLGGGGSSGAGVSSLNSLQGAVTLACAAPLSCSSSGNTITISQSGAFSITSFTGCSSNEIGTAITNPTFSAAYSTTPSSAQITNTASISSPFTLTSPFNSATIPGTFSYSSATNVTFTLSAIQGSTQSANCVDSWNPAIFSGVGTAGATLSVSASGASAILSTGDILPRFQLGAEVAGGVGVGTTFNVTPSGQVVYLLLLGGSHTFIDNNSGFPFAMNAPITVSFVNAHGVTVVMYLYQSTNTLYGSFAPRVASYLLIPVLKWPTKTAPALDYADDEAIAA